MSMLIARNFLHIQNKLQSQLEGLTKDLELIESEAEKQMGILVEAESQLSSLAKLKLSVEGLRDQLRVINS